MCHGLIDNFGNNMQLWLSDTLGIVAHIVKLLKVFLRSTGFRNVGWVGLGQQIWTHIHLCYAYIGIKRSSCCKCFAVGHAIGLRYSYNSWPKFQRTARRAGLLTTADALVICCLLAFQVIRGSFTIIMSNVEAFFISLADNVKPKYEYNRVRKKVPLCYCLLAKY